MIRSFVISAALLAMPLASEAQAALIDVTYTGQVTTGFDVNGLFGNAGDSLVGRSITVAYSFDTRRSTLVKDHNGASYSGGSEFGTNSPASSVAIDIGGKTASFKGPYYGVLAEQSTPSYSFQSHGISLDENTYVFSSVSAEPGALKASLLEDFTYNVASSDVVVGSFQFTSGGTYGTFSTSSLSETVISNVPLPTGLPLFGLALVTAGAVSMARKARTSRPS